MLSIGGDFATQQSGLSNEFTLLLIGLDAALHGGHRAARAGAAGLGRSYVPGARAPPAGGGRVIPLAASDLFTNDFFTALIAGGILAGVPLLLAALGELVSERAGVLNIGLEGMMLMGAYVGFVCAYYGGFAWLGFGGGALAGAGGRADHGRPLRPLRARPDRRRHRHHARLRGDHEPDLRRAVRRDAARRSTGSTASRSPACPTSRSSAARTRRTAACSASRSSSTWRSGSWSPWPGCCGGRTGGSTCAPPGTSPPRSTPPASA